MKNVLQKVFVVCFLASPLLALAQKETLAVGAVEPTPALSEDIARKGKSVEMRRVIEAMDGHLLSALTQVRKFSVVGRSDLKEVIKEQDLGDSGIVDASTAAEKGKVKGAKYRLVTKVDSFLEENSQMAFATGRTGNRRRFQISAQAKIYDASTGELLDAPNLQVEKTDAVVTEGNFQTDAKRTDELMPLLARELAEKIAARTVDVVFPAKIIDREEKLVTINRGDGMPIKAGEIWNAFGPTKTIRDPDSGAEIKRKGALVGKVKITSVEPAYSQGEILEDSGISVGSVLTRP